MKLWMQKWENIIITIKWKWTRGSSVQKFLAVYSANKLQFLHILEYCGMQGKYENRVKNDNKFFLEIPGLLSSKTEQEKSK